MIGKSCFETVGLTNIEHFVISKRSLAAEGINARGICPIGFKRKDVKVQGLTNFRLVFD